MLTDLAIEDYRDLDRNKVHLELPPTGLGVSRSRRLGPRDTTL